MGIKNFFKREKVEKKQESKARYGFVLNQRGIYDFISGYTTISETAEFKTCIDIIADLVSNMTIYLMKNTEKGDIRLKNELSKKIDINPCKFMTKKAWIYFIVKNLLINGNAVVFPVFDKNGYLEDLIPKTTKNLGFNWDFSKQDYYILQDSNRYYSDEFIHFVLNPDEIEFYKGRGLKIDLKEINEALNLATSTRKSFLKGQYMPSLIVKVDSTEELLETEEGKESIEDKYLSRRESGKPWIIPAEMLEINQVKPLTLNDLALNDSVILDKKTVASMMGVPAFLLGVGSFNEEEFNNFIQTKIMSIGKIIEQTLTKSLIYSPDLYFKCNARSLYSYNFREIAEIGQKLFTSGLVLGNEVRDWIGLTPLDELNELIILENYIPASKIADQKKLNKGGEKNGDGKKNE
ncbi:phage portal protein [Parvimonas micra]|uniref:phage portal protein n=1 Tax=Parvimonas micra TaxID=33033 RepID=UPI0003F6B99E|nr:phage portal protein [Parvimonas micra]